MVMTKYHFYESIREVVFVEIDSIQIVKKIIWWTETEVKINHQIISSRQFENNIKNSCYHKSE